MNELKKVLGLIESFRASGSCARDFARRKGLHPSALSRILRVGELPPELLSELASFERLSRTHLEVLATAPSERRAELLASVREGRSTYRLRDRRETTAVQVGSQAEPQDPLGRALGASAEETQAFALELLSLLMKSSPERVRSSLAQFRAARSASERAREANGLL